jgi:hypothetical protein
VSYDTPPTFAASQATVLRRAWLEVAASAAPQLADLPGLLDQRLADLEQTGLLDEPTLLAVAEEASQYAMEQGAGDVARALSKRLRRAIYEFLLALDAVNPAELAPAPVAPAPPPSLVVPSTDPEPRTPVAFMPSDVPGADDTVAALPAAAPVPLWEQAAPPPPVREVYRVATRDAEPRDLPAPAAEPEAVAETPVAEQPAAVVLDEMAAAPEAVAAEFAGAETETDVAEAQILEARAYAAEVVEALVEPEAAEVAQVDDGVAPIAEAPEAEAEWDVAEAPQSADLPEVEAAAGPEFPFEPAVHVEYEADAQPEGEIHLEPEAEAQPEPEVYVESEPEVHVEPAPEAQPAPEAEVQPEPVAEAAGPFEAELPAAPAELAQTPWDAAPAAAEAQPAAPANGARPPRDLLRVPRQFRRLPPLAARHHNGHGAALEATDPTALPELTPTAEMTELPGPIATTPEPPAPAAQVDDDDAFGVPAVPWTVAAQPDPEPTPEPQPVAEHEDPEEDMGVPFGPFAFADDAADLPRPPALVEEPLYPPPGADQLFITPLPTARVHDEPALWTPGPVPTPPYAQPAPAPEPFPIAPREGFHLIDPGTLELPASANPFLAQVESPAADVTPGPAAPPAEHSATPPPVEAPHLDTEHYEQHDDGSWRVRQSPRAQLLAERMAQKRREEAARAAFEAASVHDDDHERGRHRKRRTVEDAVPDLATARRQLDEHLRKKRGAEAGALLQRLAQQLGGREIADLALDSGDRCRALGQSRSATNCYLAAWRADPLYETPLWRLSDICLNDQEIELAVGYLERIAELMRSRGDDEGAIGVYRKIAMIAPERQDVRDVIRLAKTTGRLDG